MHAKVLLIMGPKGGRKGASCVELCTWVLAAVLPGFKSSLSGLYAVLSYRFLSTWETFYFVEQSGRWLETMSQIYPMPAIQYLLYTNNYASGRQKPAPGAVQCPHHYTFHL